MRHVVALACIAAIAGSTTSEKLFVFVTGLQGSGTTMVCRVLGHAPHAIAFGGRTHPAIPLELHAWRELLLSVGMTTDSTWEAAERLELIASPPVEPSCSREDGHGRANATLKRALKEFASARGCAGCVLCTRFAGLACAHDMSAAPARGRRRYEAFSARTRAPRAGDARRFVEPLTERLRQLMDGPPFGAPERVDSRDVDPGTPAPRSVFVFHKSMPFKGHRAPVRARSAQRPSPSLPTSARSRTLARMLSVGTGDFGSR